MSNLPEQIIIPEKTDSEDIEKLHNFYTYQKNESKCIVEKIAFDKEKVAKLLLSFGFFRYEQPDGSCQFVQIVNNKIKITQERFIIDAFEDYINSLPDRIIHISTEEAIRDYTIKAHELRSIFYKLNTSFFDFIFSRLRPERPIEILKDDKTNKYIFFENCVVDVTPTGINLLKYSDINGCIWESSVIPRKLAYSDKKGDYETFAEDITGSDESRKTSLMSCIGYLMHNFYENDLFAIFMTDVNQDNTGEAAGGTGKGLIGKAIDQILNRNRADKIYIAVPGKGLDLHKDTRYSRADLSTSVIHIEDADKNFDINALYNDITDGATIRQMYANATIKYVKFLISINHTIIINQGSDARRLLLFELANYYSADYRPVNKFGKWFFSTEWTNDDWNLFYSFMIRCSLTYMENGVIRPAELNYSTRTILEQLPEDFVYWFSDQLTPYLEARTEHEFAKQALFTSFIEKYKDFDNAKFKQATFSKYCKRYCDLKHIPNCTYRGTNDLFVIFPTEITYKKFKAQKAEI